MAQKFRSIPVALWTGLAIAVLLDAPVQLLWKSIATRYAAVAGETLRAQIHWFAVQWHVWILFGCFAAQFFNWMWVLTQADLSFAQPFTALSYLTVGTGAALIFHEQLSVGRIAGILLILCGVALVGSTPHRTTADQPESIA